MKVNRRNKNQAQGLLSEFSNIRRQVIIHQEDLKINKQCKVEKGFPTEKVAPKRKVSYYDRYKLKLDNEDFDNFNSRDLMYFFSEVARANGSRYVEANERTTMRQFSLCKKRGYTSLDIVTAISFLFESDQDYLEVSRITPSILVSTWCNTIFPDSQDWVEDKYVPKSKRRKSSKKLTNREWQGSTNTEDTKIGEWGI